MADFLKESKIKSQTGVKLNEAIEHGIGEILEELLENIENSKIHKLIS
ncbi:MAG: hypothetical protein ACR2LL_01090 [Nitrosopumilus sp.]